MDFRLAEHKDTLNLNNEKDMLKFRQHIECMNIYIIEYWWKDCRNSSGKGLALWLTEGAKGLSEKTRENTNPISYRKEFHIERVASGGKTISNNRTKEISYTTKNLKIPGDVMKSTLIVDEKMNPEIYKAVRKYMDFRIGVYKGHEGDTETEYVNQKGAKKSIHDAYKEYKKEIEALLKKEYDNFILFDHIYEHNYFYEALANVKCNATLTVGSKSGHLALYSKWMQRITNKDWYALFEMELTGSGVIDPTDNDIKNGERRVNNLIKRFEGIIHIAETAKLLADKKK